MSDHVLGEFPDLTPDQLRHTFVKPHDCPGLEPCSKHPKWRVVKYPAGWWVQSPSHPSIALHPTHAEAITLAQKEAIQASAEWYQQGT